jgi:hypothetical protein
MPVLGVHKAKSSVIRSTHPPINASKKYSRTRKTTHGKLGPYVDMAQQEDVGLSAAFAFAAHAIALFRQCVAIEKVAGAAEDWEPVGRRR